MIGLAFTFATGIMVAVCVAASWISGTDEDADRLVAAAAISFLASATVIVSNLTGIAFSRFPGFDLAALVLFWSSHRAAPAQWKADLAFILVGLLGVHAWFYALSDQGPRAVWTYVLLKNVLFGSQVAVLSLAGGLSIVRASLDRRGLLRRGPDPIVARLP
jgi:hypothetical protein